MTVGEACVCNSDTVMPASAGIHASLEASCAVVERKVKQPCVYMLASKRDGVLYIGVTSDLADRVSLHKQQRFVGFTKKHKVQMLVYFEMHHTMDEAIRREKQLKKWNRAWKVRLIEQMNPEWQDLWDESGEVKAGGSGGLLPTDERLERED